MAEEVRESFPEEDIWRLLIFWVKQENKLVTQSRGRVFEDEDSQTWRHLRKSCATFAVSGRPVSTGIERWFLAPVSPHGASGPHVDWTSSTLQLRPEFRSPFLGGSWERPDHGAGYKDRTWGQDANSKSECRAGTWSQGPRNRPVSRAGTWDQNQQIGQIFGRGILRKGVEGPLQSTPPTLPHKLWATPLSWSLLCLLYTPFLACLPPGQLLFCLRFFELAVLYFGNSLPLDALRAQPFTYFKLCTDITFSMTSLFQAANTR